MSLETEFYSRLSGYAGLSSIVGARIYPVRLPQNVSLPAVSYQRISSQRPSAFTDDTGDLRARMQVDCWAERFAKSNQALFVVEQVRAALQRWSGGNIQQIFLDNEHHDYDEKADVYRITLEFIIWYKE